MGRRHLQVLLAVAVDAEAHDARHRLAVGLDVDVGGALVVGVDDDLVAELDDAAVGLVDLGLAFLLALALDLALLARAEVVDDPAEVGLLHDGPGLAVARAHAGEDVLAQAHHEVAARRQVHGLDRVEAREVVGVLDRDLDGAVAALERRAHVLLQEVRRDALLQVLGNLAAALPGGAAVELPERLQHLVLRDVHLLDQDLRDVELVDAGRRDRLLDVLLGDEPLVDERPELGGLVGAGGAVLVVEGDAEDLAELLRGLDVLLREGAAAALVDELQHAQQVLVEQDRGREHLRRLEAGGLVPALVEAQAGVEPARARPRRRRSRCWPSCARAP